MTQHEPAVDDAVTLDLVPLGAMVIDADLRVIQWNRTLADWTGVSRQQASGAPLRELYASLADGPYERRLREMFDTGLPVYFSETLHRHFLPIPPQGGLPIERMIQRTRARLLPGKRGRALITIQDVSIQYHHLGELKAERQELLEAQRRMRATNRSLEVANSQLIEAQQTLKVSQEYTDSILRSMADMLIVLSPEGFIERANEATTTCLGYAPWELQSRPAQMLFADPPDALIPEVTCDGLTTLTNLLRQLERDGRVQDFEAQCRTKDGQLVSVSLSGGRLSSSRGEPLGYVCVMQDTTERRRIQTELARSQRLKSVGQLAAGIAHEINTPLQCISSSVEYLEMVFPSLMEVINEYAALAERNPNGGACPLKLANATTARREAPAALADATTAVHRVCEIIQAMRATTYPGGECRVETDINQLVRDAVVISRGRWKDAGTVTLHLDPQLPKPRTMPAEISQVLINLLINAGDALHECYPRDGQLGSIEVRTCTQEELVVVEVSDNGPGIPEATRERIFEPFFTTKPIGKGTGQGLAFSYQAITQLGGGLTLQNPAQGGARFVVTLPREAAAEPTRVAAGAQVATPLS